MSSTKKYIAKAIDIRYFWYESLPWYEKLFVDSPPSSILGHPRNTKVKSEVSLRDEVNKYDIIGGGMSYTSIVGRIKI